MQKVERGEDPLAVVRDPARNSPMIEIRREQKAHFSGGGFIQDSFSGGRSFVTKSPLGVS